MWKLQIFFLSSSQGFQGMERGFRGWTGDPAETTGPPETPGNNRDALRSDCENPEVDWKYQEMGIERPEVTRKWREGRTPISSGLPTTGMRAPMFSVKEISGLLGSRAPIHVASGCSMGPSGQIFLTGAAAILDPGYICLTETQGRPCQKSCLSDPGPIS